ncbi:MAG TPA: CGNR zinc finger domain-containing protein [Jatrophihabitans sp.]|nr:CGNR zinc finger domain-containing protein [Jatrophihabitans sp.]
MLFAHDTEVTLAAMAALVNTAEAEPDELSTVAELLSFARSWQWSALGRLTAADVNEVRALRPVARRFWQLSDDDAAEQVNRLLADSHALPRLVKHDDWDYHLHAVPDQSPLARRMTVEFAMAMVDVIRTQQLDRLRECAADGCQDVYVDLSKNSSRRFCSSTCGNRANVAAYRARRR